MDDQQPQLVPTVFMNRKDLDRIKKEIEDIDRLFHIVIAGGEVVRGEATPAQTDVFLEHLREFVSENDLVQIPTDEYYSLQREFQLTYSYHSMLWYFARYLSETPMSEEEEADLKMHFDHFERDILSSTNVLLE